MSRNWMASALGAMMLMGAASSAVAAPILFTVTGGSFTTGTGYGTGSGQLDATFTSLVAPQSFSLNNTGDVFSFLFGRVQLNETCINAGGIGSLFDGCSGSGDETNNLGVTANLVFTNPLSTTVQNVAVTGAFAGTVDGDPTTTDFFIDFSPVSVSFGISGVFTVDIGDLFFSSRGPITNGANVVLATVPVPEPVSLALFGAGLLGLGLARRCTKAAVTA